MTDQDKVREISRNITVLKNIEKIKEFMFADLDKTIKSEKYLWKHILS